MIDHTGVQVGDAARSRRFYDAALAPLGYAVLREVPVEFTGGAVVLGYGVRPVPDFWMVGGTPNQPRVHVAFRADSREDRTSKAPFRGRAERGPNPEEAAFGAVPSVRARE